MVTVLFAQTANAQNGHGNTRPGWGHGDKNHVHTGPPGSVRPGDFEARLQEKLTKMLEKLRERNRLAYLLFTARLNALFDRFGS